MQHLRKIPHPLGRTLHRRRRCAWPRHASFFGAVAAAEVAKVNLPVAVLIWAMIIPMSSKIDFGSLSEVKQHWRGVGVTLFINWAVKPFSMALLGSVFIGHVFAPWLPADQITVLHRRPDPAGRGAMHGDGLRLANLCEGDPNYTLSQVALNDASWSSVCALVGLLLGVASITVPWGTLLLSVLLYIVVPVVVAQAWRGSLLRAGRIRPNHADASAGVAGCAAGDTGAAVRLPGRTDRLAAASSSRPGRADPDPGLFQRRARLLAQSRRFGVAWCVAAPAALIGASNFFELAVAAAISLFGLDSGAALATVVGVLVEVPVMLSVVRIVKATRGWYEAGATEPGARHGGRQ